MFRPGTRQNVQRPLRRAGLLAAALIVLWGASQFLSTPPSTPPDPSPRNAASSVRATEAHRASAGGFRPGYAAALLLLGGGAAFAVYLRRKNGGAAVHRDVLQPLGKLQLGPGQQVHLVGCGDEVLVLGTTSGSVTLLKSFPSTSFAAAVESPESPLGTADSAKTGATTAARSYRHEKLIKAAGDVAPAPAVAVGEAPTPFADVLRRFGGASGTASRRRP